MEVQKFWLVSARWSQCHVDLYYEDDLLQRVELVSYETKVIIVDLSNDTPYWYCTGTYSATTTRHIGHFTKEFFGHNMYYVAKAIARTGEVLPLTGEEVSNVSRVASNYWHRNNYPVEWKHYYTGQVKGRERMW